MDKLVLYSKFEAMLRNKIVLLEDKPEESIDATIRALWHMAAGNPVSVELAQILDLPELTENEIDDLKVIIDRRISGEPLTHITNRQQFMGIEFFVSSEALVPRKETELLGYGALEILNKCVAKNGSAKVIDVCTGSGNLALALAHHQKKAEVYASDLSSEAIKLAERNSKHMDLHDRVKFHDGDLLAAFESDKYYKNIDLLTCNPPYISSGKLEDMPKEIIGFEPSLAFDGGPFGIKILARLINEAPKFLVENGWLAFEVGLGQGKSMLKRLERNKNYNELMALEDGNGEIRAIMAQVQHKLN
ncbi:MAG: peptide chain release factor N(5)-glutamine methyltransferase [Gammaproteobacteria bacterium]|nr:peptide chain release factor N(5)-glutamine methyltransferase [Gammaproteobacteria bacterium]